MLLAKIVMQAGGGWEGHVFFRVEHPITKEGLSTNSWESVEHFCQERNLSVDEEIKIVRDSNLEFCSKYGWLIPKEHLDCNIIITSAMNYLKKIQSEITF